MSILRPQFFAGLSLLWLCGSSVPVLAQGVPAGGRAIQFSDPKVAVITSNLNSSAASRKTSLRSLDDQFKAPFNILDPADAVGGAYMPMPSLGAPALTPKAAKKLLDKKKEDEQWIFGSPEELEAQRLSAERMFGVTEYDENGTEKTQKTPFQRYWERAERERGGQTNRAGSDLSDVKTDQDIKDQAKSMFGILNLPTENSAENQTAAAKSVLTPGYVSPFGQDVSPLRSSSELFTAPMPTFTPQKNEAAVSRLNEFKQLLDNKTAGLGVANTFGVSSASAFSRPATAADYGAAPATSWRPSTVSPVNSFDSLPGSSITRPSSAFPASSLNPTPPPVAQPARTVSPSAGFQLPKRSF